MTETPPTQETDAVRRSSFPVSLGGLLEVVCFLSLLGTWLGSLGAYHWSLDLLSHFRLQYTVVCVVVVGVALVRRSPKLLVLSFVSLLWNAQLIYRVHHTAPPNAIERTHVVKPLKVLTFNVLSSNPEREAVINHVLSVDADIVCLLETDEAWRDSLEPLRLKYPHRVEELSQGNFGLACYTRLPVSSSEVRLYTPWNLPTVVLNLDYLGTPLTFIATHPIPPMGEVEASAWRSQLTQLGELAASVGGLVIVAGDLNATPWCEGMRLLTEKSGLAYRSTETVWHPTWGLHLPLMIPIDHVLVKAPMSVTRRTIGPYLGSDHRSLMVEIVR